MSKHQELCCGCIYDDLNYEELYCSECFECEYIQENEKPTNYTEEKNNGID